jgi:hypothetical protein
MGHIVGTIGLTITNFCVVPPTQRLKSSRQNQCLWCSSDPLRYYTHKPITWNITSTYKLIMVYPCFAFEPNGFLECRTLNLHSWVGSIQCTEILPQHHPFVYFLPNHFLPCKDTFMDDYDGI